MRFRYKSSGSFRTDRNHSINIPCPQCRNEFSKSFGEIETSPFFRCPRCGLPVDGREFGRGLQDYDDAINDLRRKIRDVFSD